MRLPVSATLALLSVVGASAALFPRSVRSEEAPASGIAATKASDLEWLVGRWASGDGDEGFEEAWIPAGGGTLAAVSRMVHGGKTGMYELSAVEPDADGLVLRIRHFSPGLVPWKSEAEAAPAWRLVRSGPREAVFEDPARAFPRRIAYRREAGGEGGPDVLVARLEGEQGGKPRVTEFRLTGER
jgi:hypothetical protein